MRGFPRSIGGRLYGSEYAYRTRNTAPDSEARRRAGGKRGFSDLERRVKAGKVADVRPVDSDRKGYAKLLVRTTDEHLLVYYIAHRDVERTEDLLTEAGFDVEDIEGGTP